MSKLTRSIAGAALTLLATGALATPVTFQVNMDYQISQGNFTPGSGQVQVRGSFDGWNYNTAPVVMTNVPSTYIYQAVVDVTNAPGSTISYKYWHNGAGTGSVWEGGSDRSFVFSGSAQTVYRYFNDVFAGGPPINVTFQVDMAVQITKGAFDTNTGTVEARGPFEANTWSGGFFLTNVTGTTIWAGTYGITNVPPGGYIEHKFVMNGGTWEAFSGNRLVQMPAADATLPVVFFSNELPTAVPVTFQVDMSLAPWFYPEAGDIVEARGGFQVPNAWSSGFTLTNAPGSSIYSGTIGIAHMPGTVEAYKFTIAKGTAVTYEMFGQPDRTFVLSNDVQVLPLTRWNNLIVTNDVLPQDVFVTFTVNMQNATNQNLYNKTFPFDPASMPLYINGDFFPEAPGQWMNWNEPLPKYELKETIPGSLIYTNTFLVSRGCLVALTYKYGVDTYWTDQSMSTDNELPENNNHVRYVRTLGGTTVFPEDIFGAPVVEPLVGDVVMSGPTAGYVNLTWRGRPGVNLQESSDLVVWSDVPDTYAASSASRPASASGAKYYRLVKP